ncbi:hypothetical protein PCANC_26462 [Puccinia coronata f. sp. avenae]|uniref:Uncharacterized protein n=1 Tax=Puccinia coronata f. sp. avenae TaxID=200324 RepID=A0A2N5TRJ6_9BASI|nr:hypothetical protein PCANC_26462 [Puccinia coronata f. sp. avenae]
MDINSTWCVLRGLKNNWIKLVEHQFDELLVSTSIRKRKGQTKKIPSKNSNPPEPTNKRKHKGQAKTIPSENSNPPEPTNTRKHKLQAKTFPSKNSNANNKQEDNGKIVFGDEENEAKEDEDEYVDDEDEDEENYDEGDVLLA